MLVRNFIVATALFLSATSSLASSENASATQGNTTKKWLPQVELETKLGTSGRKLIVPKIMTPIWQDEDSLLFSDVRFKADNQDSQEFNLGIGYREMVDDNWIIGGYGFFDRLKSDYENTYSQATFGLEALSENNDLRINAYIPEGTENAVPGSGSLVISGSQLSINGGFERALPGFDAEIGRKLPFDFADVRAYAGGFSFKADGYEDIAGPRGRLEITLNEQYTSKLPRGLEVTFGVEAQHDDVRGGEQFAMLEFKIPFGSSEKYVSRNDLKPLEQRMNRLIERDVDVVSNTGGSEAAQINGQTLNSIVQIDSDDDFVATVDAAAENTLILVDGSGGTINSAAGDADMKSGQAIIGGGSTVTVTGSRSGASYSHTFAGTAPTLDGSNSTFFINAADNTTINGVTLDDANAISIRVAGKSGVTFQDVTISDSTSVGIYMTGSNSNITFTDINIDQNGTSGIDMIGSANSNFTFTNITITDALIGLVVRDVDNFTGSNINISDSAQGLYFIDNSNSSITSSSITDIAGDALYIAGTSSSVTFSDLTITNIGQDAIEIDNTTNTISISNTSINTAGDKAFEFDNATITGLSGTGNTVAAATGGNCSTTGATITGSLSYNATTCP
jgi:hypothetical protein